jgi:hypothetical protein
MRDKTARLVRGNLRPGSGTTARGVVTASPAAWLPKLTASVAWFGYLGSEHREKSHECCQKKKKKKN